MASHQHDVQRLFTSFFEDSPLAMMVKTAAGHYVQANAAACEKLGVPHDQLIGRHYSEVVDERSAAEIAELDRRMLETGEARVLEQTYRPDDEDRHVLVASFPVLNDKGDEPLIGLILFEITEKTKAEKRFRALSDHHPVAILISRLEDNEVLLANPAFFDVIGLPGQSDVSMISRTNWFEDQADHDAYRAAVREHEKYDGWEGRIRRVGGAFWGSVSWRRIIYDDEPAVVTSVLEIGDRKEAEGRLRDSEARLSAFLDHAPAALYLKDREDRYVVANKYLAARFQADIDDILGKTPHELLDPAAAAEADEIDRIIAETRQPHVRESDFETPTGRRHAMTIRFPVFDDDGEILYIGGVVLDMTDQKAAEAELRQSREALHQSEKMNALGSLLAGVSHELNNPLAVVVGEAILLEEEAEGSDMAEGAARIRRAAERCSRIVQTFLAMARQKTPERRPADANELIRSALELAAYGLRSDGVDVAEELAENLPPLLVDPDQISQILLNLVMNAGQALQQCGADRTLVVKSRQQGEKVEIDVCDNGPGIEPEIRARIFEPFFTTKPQGTGTGIGLSFSLGIAEAHGGSLRLVPVDVGTCFRLTLPTATPDQVAAGKSEEIASHASLSSVLIVDDEPELAKTLSRMIEREGVETTIAVGGQEAIRLLETNDYGAVLSDIRMPGVDGPALYEWIETHRPHLIERIAFVTGDTLGPTANSFLARIERPVLEKPFSRAALRGLLATLSR